MTTTAKQPAFRWASAEQAHRYTDRIQEGGYLTRQAVAERMFQLQCGVWHASHTLLLEHIARGEAGYGTCTFCGGPTAPNQNNLHYLCKARADLGRPTPRLDSTPKCPCHPCSKARGE